jgi:hypothetical protein
MSRSLIVQVLIIALLVSGCASSSRKQADPDPNATEPSPYRSYKWIHDDYLWEGFPPSAPSKTTTIDHAIKMAQFGAELTAISTLVAVYVAPLVMLIAAPVAVVAGKGGT